MIYTSQKDLVAPDGVNVNKDTDIEFITVRVVKPGQNPRLIELVSYFHPPTAVGNPVHLLVPYFHNPIKL